MSNSKGPGGRPTKYEPRFCDMLVEHMKDGASVASFAAEIGVARSSINKWAEENEEFSEALSRGKSACAAWWERMARKVAEAGGGNGQSAMIAFGLKNMARDDWSDRVTQEHTGPNGGPVETVAWVSGLDDETLKKIAAAKAGAGAGS